MCIMYEYIYITGGNYKDKRTKVITYDEARKMLIDAQVVKTYNPICSMRILKNNEPFRAFIYFNFRVIVVDLDIGKQIWYEKVQGSKRYFIDQIVYDKYNNQSAHIQLFFRNRNFSDPNICMIKKQDEKNMEYYVATIDDTFFYRDIEFGETETAFKDLETSFDQFLLNVQKCDKRFIRK